MTASNHKGSGILPSIRRNSAINDIVEDDFDINPHENFVIDDYSESEISIYDYFGKWEIVDFDGAGYVVSSAENPGDYIGSRIFIDENIIEYKFNTRIFVLHSPKYVIISQTAADFAQSERANYSSFDFDTGANVFQILIFDENKEWGRIWIKDKDTIVVRPASFYYAKRISDNDIRKELGLPLRGGYSSLS
jgi:hypothetical protein